MAAKKAKQTKAKQTKPDVKSKGVVIEVSVPSLQHQVAQMNKLLDEFVACSKTEDEWLAALISLSVEAAKVAKVMGFDKADFIKAFGITTDEVYERDAQKPAVRKPVKKVVKKPVKSAKKAVKKPVKSAKNTLKNLEW